MKRFLGLILMLIGLSTSLEVTAQRVRTTAVFDADTSTRPKAGFYGVGVRSGQAYLVPATGNNVRLANYSLFTGLTTNYLSKWNGSKLVNSGVFESGGNVGVGTASPTQKLDILSTTSNTSTVENIVKITGTSSGTTNSTFGTRLVLSVKNSNGNLWDAGIATLNSAYGSNLSDLGFYTAESGNILVEKMRILAGGNVGIGTPSPAFPLVVERPTSHTMGLLTPDIGTAGRYTGITFGYTGNTYQKGGIYYESQDGNGRGKLHFALNGAASSANTSISDSKMMIDYSGNVGIGTPSPSNKLTVLQSSDVIAQGLSIFRANGSDWTGFYKKAVLGTLDDPLVFSSNYKNDFFAIDRVGKVFIDGNVGIGTTSPTQKLDVSGVIKSNAGLETTFSSPGLSFGASKFMFQQESANFTRAYFSGIDGSTYGNLEFYRATSTGTPEVVLSLTSSGKVGIGTKNPLFPTHSNTLNNSTSMTLGSSTGVAWGLTKAEEGYGLYMGISPSGSSWIQAGRTNSATAYDILLQSSGGNVGINTTTPTSKLQVVGLPTYADNAAATSGGLTAGAFYRTSTGVLMVVY